MVDYGVSLNATFLYQIFYPWKALSRAMRKPFLCLCENKGAYQLRGKREDDQRICFRYTDSSSIPNFKLLAFFCDCTGRFVSDLVRNPEDLCSHGVAPLKASVAHTSLLVPMKRASSRKIISMVSDPCPIQITQYSLHEHGWRLKTVGLDSGETVFSF